MHQDALLIIERGGERAINILHAGPVNWERISGINTAAQGLISAQNSLENVHAALLMTGVAALPPHDVGFSVFNIKDHNNGNSLVSLPEPFDKPDIVVFHSTYIPSHRRIAHGLRKARIPYIIMPHGGMTLGAQRVKRLKKKIGNLLFFNDLVRHSVALHCLTPAEAEEASIWHRPTFVVGNGTDIPIESDLAAPGQSKGIRFVFIGRLDPYHKGLDVLLEACALVKPLLLSENASIEIYGPDHNDSVTFLARRISQLRLDDIVTLPGPILGEAKKLLLKRADVFIHTSRFEGHPMAVLEALAHGVPCLLTPGTNISQEVATAGAGWEVQLSPENIADGIIDIFAKRKDLPIFSKRARALAVDKFSWQQIAKDQVAFYKRYLGQGS